MKVLLILWILTLHILYVYPQKSKLMKYEELVRLSSSELIKKGNYFLQKNEEDTALTFYLVLSAKYNEQMDKLDQYLCALSCNKLGTIYYQKKNYSKAFDFFLKALKICGKHNFQNLLPELYKNIGNVYCIFQDYDRGNASYEKGLALCTQQGDVDMQVKILCNLSGMCCYAGDIEKAKYYYRQMKEVSQETNDVMMGYFYDLNLGSIYANEQKYDSALSCYKASAEYASRFHLDPKFECVSYCELVQVYENINQNDSALHYLKLNLQMTKEHHLIDMLAETLKSIARVYGKRGEKEKEQLYKEQYLTISDSLLNLQEISKMKRERFVYEMDQTREQVESLNEEKTQKELKIKAQQKVLLVVSLTLLVFVIMLLLVYSQKRKLRLAYRDLYKRNNEILKSEERSRKSQMEYENNLTEERLHYKELAGRFKQMMALSAQQNEDQTIQTEDESGQKDESKANYSVDKLTDEQKETILRQIHRVMADQTEICDCDFSLDRLATLIGSNARYVSQIINDTYGKNFRAYINEYRIKEAQLRLMNTAYANYTIKAIAQSVGYKSHANFIIIFKKMTGIAPSMYQKMAMEEKEQISIDEF